MLELARSPVILGARQERLSAEAAATTKRPANAAEYPSFSETQGKVFADAGGATSPERTWTAVRDGNRSAILPDYTAKIGGRGYALSVKGVGSRPPLYGDSPLGFAFKSDFGAASAHGEGHDLAGARQISSEAWFGESPYGAQGQLPSAFSLMVTEFSHEAHINGFYLCPTIEVNEFPQPVAEGAQARYWYRRYRGPFLQEQRLVPSNIRVYHESDTTLGQSPGAVMQAFGVESVEAADSLIENFLRSSFAALTLYVRTMKETRWGYRGLDYHGVFLDKDAVIAPDGTLHFVDIEGLDWVLGGADIPVEERVREQFNHNFYEVMYALDVLLRERERIAGRPLRQDERRQALPARFELALAYDRFLRAETSAAGVDLVVRPPFPALGEVVVRAIDLR